jgi:hypothetical protein
LASLSLFINAGYIRIGLSLRSQTRADLDGLG